MIRGNFDLTRPEYDEAAHVMQRLEGQTDWLRPVSASAYAAAAVGFLLLVARLPVAGWLAPTLLIAHALFTLTYPMLFIERELNRRWDREPMRSETFECEAGPAGLFINTTTSRTHLNWSAFTTVAYATRRRIRRDLDLPMRDAYSDFIVRLAGGAAAATRRRT
jgi:hypothetical protein